MKPCLFVAFLCLLPFTLAFEIGVQSQPNDCNVPRITEYIQNFKIPVNDLSILINSNLTTLPISDIQNKNTKFFKINAGLQYIGTGRSIDRQDPRQYIVSNDSFSMALSMNANVSKTIGHNTYNITAKVSSVPVSYHKGINTQNISSPYYVNGTTYKFASSSIQIVSITPDPAKQKEKIMALIPDLFTAIDQQFKSIGSWLNDNVQKQTLGTIFPDSSYAYDYYGWTQTISTKVMSLEESAQNDTLDFLIGYTAGIVGQTDDLCPQSTITIGEDSYSEFISMEFIQNMANNVVQLYDKYQNIAIDKSWIRSRNFQFRLIDLEFVLQDALVKYSTSYMNPIDFSCSLKSIISGYIDEKEGNLHQIVHWGCQGFLIMSQTQKIKILDFQPQIDHLLEVRLSGGDYLTVYSNVLTLIDIKFNEVDSMNVNNQELVKVYMKEFYNDMRRYVPGTYFKVKKGASSLEWVVDHDTNIHGLWIG